MVGRAAGWTPGRGPALFIAFFILFASWAFSPPAQALEGQLNLNRATAEDLRRLPFVGEVRAKAIIRHRQNQGPFTSLDELLASGVVGRSTFEAIRPYLTLDGPSTLLDSAAQTEKTGAGEQIKILRHIATRPGEIQVIADQEYFPTLLTLIQHARQSIELSMFIFKTTTSPQNRPTMIAKELGNAVRRGVKVEILLEKSGYDPKLNEENEKVAAKLRRQGVTVRFDSPEVTTHTKVVIVDRRLVLLGSHNLTHAALAYNHEISLLIDSQPLADRLAGYLNLIKTQ